MLYIDLQIYKKIDKRYANSSLLKYSVTGTSADPSSSQDPGIIIYTSGYAP